MMDRAEHLQWSKERALEYVDSGDLSQAVASFMSDMNKHEELALTGPRAMFGMLGMTAAMSGNANEVRSYINGFN